MLTKVVLLDIVYPMYYINIEWIFSTPCILCLGNRNRSRYMYYTIKFNSCKILYFSTFSQQHYLNHSHCCKFLSPQNLCYSNHSKKKKKKCSNAYITDDYHDDQRVNGLNSRLH